MQTISIGQLGLGPIAVGNLVLNNIDFPMNAAQTAPQNPNVTVTIIFTVEWHVHIGLPDGKSDRGALRFRLRVRGQARSRAHPVAPRPSGPQHRCEAADLLVPGRQQSAGLPGNLRHVTPQCAIENQPADGF